MTRLAIQNCLVGALIFCLLASCGETAEQPAVEWERTKEKEDKEPVVADRESAITDAEQSARREKLLRRATRSTPIGGEKQCLSPYFFVLSDDPDTDRLPLKSTRAEVDIAGVIARVKVVQTYSNEGRKTLEAVYIFPASTRAAVHAMRMKIGERVIEARIKEREKARADYENARREGKSASLLEQMRPNVFQMNVANILPGDEIKVELEYTELLRPEKGVYEFVYPSIVGPRYSKVGPQDVSAREAWVENPYLPEGQKPTYDFGLNAEVRTGIPLSKVMSPSHDIESSFLSKYRARVVLGNSKLSGNRDFVLHYSLAGERIQSGLLLYPGQEENFFLMMMEPSKRIAPRQIVRREYIFIMDVSGSMNGFPLNISKRLMADVLESLNERDFFNVLFFAGGNFLLAEKSLRASRKNVHRALKAVDSQRGAGGTELLAALSRALELPRREGVSRIVVIATDGYVRVEKEAFDLIRSRASGANVFAFGIGSSVNRFLVEGMAHAGRGESFVVLDPEKAAKQASRFREYVSTPLMQGIKIAFEGFEAYDVVPQKPGDLFAERPIVVFGKYRGEPSGAIVVTGHVPGERLEGRMDVSEAQISESNSSLRTMWARDRVRTLGDLERLEPGGEREKEITALGLEYKLLTDYTSFVAVDSLVRAAGNPSPVKQPLPLPRGVPASAIAGTRNRVSGLGGGSLGALGSLRTYGKGSGSTACGHGTLNLLRGGKGSGGRAAVSNLYGGGAALAGGRTKQGGVVFKSPGRKIRVRGKLSRKAVTRVIRKNLRKIQACYEKNLLLDTSLKGKIVVEFTIGADGRVVKMKIKRNTMNSVKVANCVAAVLKSMRFPKPNGGKVKVIYPFIFSSVGF